MALTVMLVAGMIQSIMPWTVSAAQTAAIYGAAYMGATTTEGTTLPASVEIQGVAQPVSWHIGDDTFAVPYDTAAVTGTAANGTSVLASVQVIPPAANPLAYFVDSGRGGDSYSNPATASPVYEAVKAISGNTLLNQTPDQRYVSGTTEWGFDDSVQKVKNSASGNLTDPAADPSIWVVGLRADPNTNDIVYKLKSLAAGTYTLSSGFHDWYGSRSREIRPRIEYKNLSGAVQTISFDQFNTSSTKLVSGEFTVPADIDPSFPMTLTYAYVKDEKPILSWFAVAHGGIKQTIDDARATAASMVKVMLNGNDVKTDNVNGLTFKGFGVLSANSTSALLMDYKSEHPEAYAQLLRVLFGGEHPIMTHVKIEMGNDRNTSTGPDPATMRTADEEANVKRHPGFQLAADAKAVNPDLKVSFLRWEAPGWANNNNNIYAWYKKTILEAYRQYGYMVDYINPGVNEHSADLTWTKDFANRIKNESADMTAEEKALYNKIKVVISDEVGIGSFGGSMISDAVLRDAVAVAGYHYNTDDDGSGNFKKLAEQYDKEIWNSEAQATFSNSALRPNNNTKDPAAAGTGIGGAGSPLEMGNTIIKGFVNSRRTHFVYQPAIGSFYEGGQYSFKELVSARDPWSGWIHYDAGLAVLQHFNWFIQAGWENESNTAGIWRAVPQASSTGATGTNPVNGRNGTPSYMTIAASDRTNFSTVIVNDSEYESFYKLQTVNMTFSGNPALEMWETRAADAGQAFNSNYMQYLGDIHADGGGVYTVHVKPYSIVTVTTLDNHEKPEYNEPLPVEGDRPVLDTDDTGDAADTEDGFLYADDFDYTNKTAARIDSNGEIAGTQSYIESRGGSKSVIPRYTHDRNGAFEAYLPDGSDNYILRQQVDKAIMGLGGTWNNGDPVTAIGDNRWANYKASVDVSFENSSTQGGANYAAIGARYQGGGSSHSIAGTPYVLKYWLDGGWQLLVNNSAKNSGNVATGTGGLKIEGFNTAYDAWHNIAIQVAGNKITAYLDGHQLATYTDPTPKLTGRVDLASGYYNTRFDNLQVETVPGYVPYYSELMDNLEMYDLASTPNSKLKYSGSWNHQLGQGMYVYQRTISTSQEAGASLEYTFTGTGLDILGENNGSAVLEVTVDGVVVEPSVPTKAASTLYQTYTLRGLSHGQHTVSFKVLSGALTVDAVGVITANAKEPPNTSVLEAAVTSAQAVEREERFKESDWQHFVSSLQTAEAALNEENYLLDQEGSDQLAVRLSSAQDKMTIGNVKSLSSPLYAATYTGVSPTLPETVEATLDDNTKVPVKVNWNLTSGSFDTPYATVAVTGTYGNLSTTCYVEVVPKDIRYFVDLNATAASTLGYDSPAYRAVSALAAQSGKPLVNLTPDQPYDSATGWGYAAQNASGASSVSKKGVVAGAYSKLTTTGIYSANQIGASVTYTFGSLPAGDYSLTFGTNDWWPTNRTENIYLQYDGKDELVDTVKLTAALSQAVKAYSFTKSGDGELKLKLVAAEYNQSPLLSFVGVAQAAADKTELQALYDQHKDKTGDHYTSESWSVFQAAIADAQSVLGSEAATQSMVNAAAQALSNAAAGLETVPEAARTAQLFATYVNTIPQLPSQVRLADAGPVYDILGWTTGGGGAITAADFGTPYERVAVQGKYADGSEKVFTAYVEVVPRQVKYYIDAGATNSYSYQAVQQLTGNGLLNGAANQPYSSGSGWGYAALTGSGGAASVISKAEQPDLDKSATGIMIDGGDPLSTLTYQLDGLEGGKSYRFTSYHRLWWDNANEMPIKISIAYMLNDKPVTQIVNRLHLDHAGHSGQINYSLNLPEGASQVRYVLTNAGSYTGGPGAGKTNKNSAVSWLAVEELANSAEAPVYSSLGGVAGENSEVWLDTNGVPIQAHGGQAIWDKRVAWNGDIPSFTANPGENDGAWIWVGEDKTYGRLPIGGIHTYASKDLYNWVDMGVALYTHRVFPVEKTADGQGIQVSDAQLAELKARAMGTAGTGVNELGQPLTLFDIDNARDFLQAYVDKNQHPAYSRANDAGFDYAAASYDEASLQLAFDRTYAYYTIMERPKMLYNEQSGKYVIIYHVDGPADSRILEKFDTLKSSPLADTGVSRYTRAQMGFAVADSPFGPFKLVNAQRMNYVDGYYDASKGMARDMTAFKDDDGKAYAIYSSEENGYTYISLLNEEYTAPARNGTEGLGETFTARVFTDKSREAPAIFKYGGYYYIITSGTTGWDPNPSIVYRANHIFGNTADGGKTFTPYTNIGNPFPNDSSNTSYRTQPTALIPYDAENGLFIYMGDRWIQKALETSGYAWIPLQISANGSVVEGLSLSDWSLDDMDDYAPLEVLTSAGAPFGLGGLLDLPDTLKLRKGSKLYENVPVSWDQASLEQARLKLGSSVVQGTLGGDLAGSKIGYQITVRLPDHLLYFANPASGEVAEYTQLVDAYEGATGKHLNQEAADQEYNPASGRDWGYTGTNTEVRTNMTTDIFQSLRYVKTGSADRDLVYKFEVGKGAYRVYVGYYDPWFQYSQSKRVAHTFINGTSVEAGRIINGDYAVAEHKEITVGNDGLLEIKISPANTGSNSDVQLSWIMIAASGDSDTVKPVITLAGEALVQLEQGAVYTDAGATAQDDRDGDITSRIVTAYKWNGTPVAGVSTVTEAVYTVHYNVSDLAGNTADEVTRSVVVGAPPVIPDTGRPVITLAGEALVQLEQGAVYTDAGATAQDDRDGDITDRIATAYKWNGMPVARVSTVTEAVYTIHYNVSDLAGNGAYEVTRTVVVGAPPVIPDTGRPVITLTGEALVQLEHGAAYTDAGATALDDRDGDITSRITVAVTNNVNSGTTLNTTVAGTYVYHYHVSDLAGNGAYEVTRTVVVGAPPVIPDTGRPVITLTGEALVQLKHGAAYTDRGATALDDRDGDITSRITVTVTNNMNSGTTLNTSVAGTYVYHYHVSDLAGNAANEVTRTVIVAAAPAESGDSNSDGDSDPTPSTAPANPSTPPSAQEPSASQILGQGDLKQDQGGRISVEWQEGKGTVLLPGSLAAAIKESGTFRIAKEEVALELPARVLHDLLNQSGDKAEEAQIKISAEVIDLSPAARIAMRASVPETVTLGIASNIYSINVQAVAKNGVETAGGASLKAPVTLTFKADPKANPDVLGVYAILPDGQLQYVGGTWDNGRVSADVQQLGQFVLLEYNRVFEDVDSSHWAHSVITRMAARHVIEGVSDAEFDPQGNVTRAEFAAMLSRALQLTSSGPSHIFADVPADAWYARAVASAAEAGLIAGRDTGSFQPDSLITREEMAVMLVRAYEYRQNQPVELEPAASSFDDAGQIGAWAERAVNAASSAGLLQGREGNRFEPQEQLTRAEGVQALYNLLK
jgi:hypothetical protein